MTKFLHTIFKCLCASIVLMSLVFLVAIMHCCLSSKYGLLPGNFVELSRLNKNSVCFLSMTSKLVFQQPRIHLKILTSSQEFTDISVSKFVRNAVWNVLCAVKF